MHDSLLTRVRRLPFIHRPSAFHRGSAESAAGRPGTYNGVPAAVLLALSPADGDDLGVVLVGRPGSMRQHAGQIAFPGGAVDAGDADGIAAALREAHEEVGIDPAAVEVLGTLGQVPLTVSGFDVLVVVGLWGGDAPLRPNPGEVERILRPTLRELADPPNHGLTPLEELIPPERFAQRQLPPGATSPTFRVDGHVVWGFTAGVLSNLLTAMDLPAPALPRGWPRTPRASRSG
jgi:8-oxo-dGTP pyrophosphatase MutT (NUDIX family)